MNHEKISMFSFLPQTLILKAQRAGPQVPPKVGRSFNKGFTLIEAMIIVLILGIIATNALPTLNSGLTDSKLSGAAGEIVTALEYAQLNAMTTGAKIRVTIDDTADTILVERFNIDGDIFGGAAVMTESDIDNGTFGTMDHPFNRGEDYLITFTAEDRFNGVDIASSVFGAGNSVTFDMLGAPSEGGTVTLSLGDKEITVAVDSLTGKVTSS